MRYRRGLTVLELVIILLVVGLIIFFLVRMRGGDEDARPGADTAVADTSLAATPLGAGEELAARLGVLTPRDSVATVGDTVAVRVRASGPTDAAVANAEVRFDVQTGGGSVQPLTATTNDVGEAEVRWILGSAAGEQRLRAAVPGNDSARVTITVQAGARQVSP